MHLREVSASTVARKLTAGAEYRELCFVNTTVVLRKRSCDCSDLQSLSSALRKLVTRREKSLL